MRCEKSVVKGLIVTVLSLFIVVVSLPTMPTEVMAAEVVIDSTTTSWEDGNTYIVNTDVTIDARVIVNGDVVLNLGEGCTLTASKGITVGPDKKLTISGGGNLIATGEKNSAGIGGSKEFGAGYPGMDCGTVVIESGTIDVTSGTYAAAIGGSYKGKGGVITINGGEVTAKSKSTGAGIGGGCDGTGGVITINGGKVKATGNESGAGIGGGPNKSADTIVIRNGEIIATGGDTYAAGIGGGNSGTCGVINISGGKITATARAGAGIGSGRYADENGTINITGGVVTADSTYGTEGIGNGDTSENGRVAVAIGSGVTVYSSETEIEDVSTVPENMKTLGPVDDVTVRAKYMKSIKAEVVVDDGPEPISGLTYTGKPQELVTTGTVTGGKMKYALGKDSTNAPADGWSESIPTATEVGTYYVWYKAVSDDGTTETAPVCIVVTIGEPSEDAHKVFVVKDRSNISGMFKKFGEKNYKYRFKVEDRAQRKIARVNRKGKIKVKKVGTVKVSLFRKVKGGTWSKVEEQTIKTEKPEIPKKITTLKVGDKVNVASFIKNNDKMINKPTSYSSSKPEVASIDSAGNLTVKKSGRTKISIIYGKGKSAAVYKVKLKI